MTNAISRRQFVAGTGALVVGFQVSQSADPARAQASAIPLSPSLTSTPQLGAWIRIGGGGEVTVFSGKAEIGQGIKTSLAQIVAEELDVGMGRITVVTADTARTPPEAVTSRSHSMIESGGALRTVSAEARAILLSMAAERLRVPVESLTVDDGTIAAKGGGERVTYWALIGDGTLKRDVTGKVRPKDPSLYKVVGKPVPRVDIPGKVTGAPSFVQDLRLSGMLHGRVLRPATDRADVKLVAIDIARASAMPGVVKVVRDGSFVGVVAEREEQAVRALAVLQESARWDLPPLAPSDGLKEHLRKSPTADRVLKDDGKVAEALASAHHRVEASYFVPYQSHGSIGPSCAVAHLTDGTLRVWTHSQDVFSLRTDLAHALGKPVGEVHLIHMEGAGCYGQNGADDVPLDSAVLALAVPGRPVRVQWMRENEFAWSPKGPAMLIDVKAGTDAAGNIVAWDYEYWTGPHVARYGKEGKSVALGAAYLERPSAPFFLQGPGADVVARVIAGDKEFYDFPNKRVVQHVTQQFAPLRTAELRGVAGMPHAFAEQSMIDELAAKAGIDPIEFRLRFIKDARMRAVIDAVSKRAGWTSGVAPLGKGRGFSTFYYDRPFSRAAAAVDVVVDKGSGRVTVKRVVAVFDVGQMINPDGVRNQMEGGIIQALSRALVEEVTYGDNTITSVDWAKYPIQSFMDLPDIDIMLLDRPAERPGGAGETQTPIIPAAIANAIFDATGVRVREIPFTPLRIKALL
jgi:CO/xanthine dehydrogenase Mo-binding subunit